MIFLKYSFAAIIATLCLAANTAVSRAQEAPASPSPTETIQPTLLDQQYDGQTHVMVAPYVWAPSVNANFQFFIPRLPRAHGGKSIHSTVDVGPSNYLPKLNAAAMGAFDIRKGNVDLYGDAIYLNASTTATISSTITGPFGRIHIPVTFDSSARLATAIWELALGFTIARSHNADLSTFLGYRDFPIYLNVSYNATVGKRGIIATSGTATPSDRTGDPIFGVRGRAFANQHWYIPYYFDFGGANNNQTWQAYGGAGYAFQHGQSFVVLYRQLDYYGFPSTAHTQRLDLGGPVLGYTFNL
ncbi:MAG: hypothetical protein JOZ77_08425 [Candidatus Eremiobacteraeota bacterium]|nr:hypothetical protein [Candidatus Eremiobacteraeota bacterium]